MFVIPKPRHRSVWIRGLAVFVGITATGCPGVEEPVPQDPAGLESIAGYELETTTERPLQQRFQAAYPESYEDGVQIFWGPDDGWIDDDLLMFWRSRLYPEELDGLNQQASEKMFSEISSQAPVFSRDATRRICAVVGASGNLLGSRYGRLIDTHNVVFRVNRAPTDDYDTDVGSKTTHHVTWPRDLDQDEFDADAFLLMTPISTHLPDIFDRILYLVDEVYQSDPQLVRIIHPEFIRYVHENWTESRLQYPSTGFIALMIALHVCDEVNVYGFGADAQGRWDRYYANEPSKMRGFHPGDLEGDLRREMEAKGILKVFRGSRPEEGKSSVQAKHQ